MMFCEKCGSILIPKKNRKGKNVLACRSCSYVTKRRESLILKEKVDINEKESIAVVDKRVETLPKTQEACPRCGYKEAFYWTVQTRAADESETRFFKCVKCTHTWRSYS